MTPRTAAQFQTLRADAQERLERAALVVFARAGYAGATVRDVAREADVAQGLLYNYYRGKQDLLAAVFRRSMAHVEASFAAADADADAPPAERLARLVRAAFALVREHLAFWQLVYGVRQQPDLVAALGPELHAWTEGVRATLEEHLRAAGRPDPAVGARLLFAAIDGVAQHYALDPAGYPLDAVAERLVATIAGAPASGSRPDAARASGQG
ncbi:MAG TPA: TetR/AcrR family transcriptional regulator [Gemmatimonadaceae bacterium]|nr:TetR/AcrR family transcriptional regulator [Gemmatimonadaceae bacterium]